MATRTAYRAEKERRWFVDDHDSQVARRISHLSFSLPMPTSHGSYSSFSYPDETQVSTRQTLLVQCVQTNRMRSPPYAKRCPQGWQVAVLLPRRGPVSGSCHTGYYDMRSPEKEEKLSYIRMKKVLLRRYVITASFVPKFEAGQESAVRETRLISIYKELKEGSQNCTERAQVGTVNISCDISLIYRGKGLTFGHHTLYAPVSLGAMVEVKLTC